MTIFEDLEEQIAKLADYSDIRVRIKTNDGKSKTYKASEITVDHEGATIMVKAGNRRKKNRFYHISQIKDLSAKGRSAPEPGRSAPEPGWVGPL